MVTQVRAPKLIRFKNPAIAPGFSRARGELFLWKLHISLQFCQQEWRFAWVQMLSRCSAPEAFQELGFLPAWQELGFLCCL